MKKRMRDLDTKRGIVDTEVLFHFTSLDTRV